MWHVTCDTRIVTHHIWQMVWCEHSLKISAPSSYGLWVMVCWRFREKGSLNEWINQSINDKGVCWTAPATGGLLKVKSGTSHITHHILHSCKLKCYYTFEPSPTMHNYFGAIHFSNSTTWKTTATAIQNTLTFDQYTFNSRRNMYVNLVHWNSMHPKKAIFLSFS